MHQDLEAKLIKFFEEQQLLMEQELGLLPLKYKAQFGDDNAAYFDWLNKVYQFRRFNPNMPEEKLTPEALEIRKTKTIGQV